MFAIDTVIVSFFFFFFCLLTFYYIGTNFECFDFIKRKFKTDSSYSIEIIDTKYNKLREFLIGRKKDQYLQTSLSLFISNLSPVIFVGIPNIVYLRGGQYFCCCLSFPIAIFITNFIFLPVFHLLKVKTTSQYLEIRFNKKIKLICLVLFFLASIAKMGIWLCTPNIVLTKFTIFSNQTGLYLTILIIVTYTALGGMKVIHKMELFQLFLMVFSLTSVVSLAASHVGGISKIYEENKVHGRLDIDFSLNPFTDKYTFWGIISSNTFNWVTVYCLQQTSLNRYFSCNSLCTAKRILYLQIPMMMIFFFIICFIGLVMYTFYFKCDPFLTKRINQIEALIALFFSDINYYHNGLLGLFIVALYSITLSSISSSLNGITTNIYEDVFENTALINKSTVYLRLMMFFFGVMVVLSMLIVKIINQTMKLKTVLINTLIGPVLGVFLLGIHVKKCNSKSALIALLSGLVFGILCFLYHFKDSNLLQLHAVNVNDCSNYFCKKNPTFCINKTITDNINKLKKNFHTCNLDLNFFELFKCLNYLFDGWIITLFTILIGCIFSFFSKQNDKPREEIEKCLAFYMKSPEEKKILNNQIKSNQEIEYTEYEFDKKDNNESLIDLVYLKKILENYLCKTEK